MKRTLITGTDNQVLRRGAAEILAITPHIRSLISDMKETLDGIEIGIGLAAPQVGENLRLFVISGDFTTETNGHRIFLNPVITARSKVVREADEGCLSLPDHWGEVERAQKVTLKAFDEDLRPFKVRAKGLLARLFQHEIDHLNGMLFVDRIHSGV